MPRIRLTDRPIKFTTTVPASLAADLEEVFRDPITGRIIYDARGALIRQLLREVIADIRAGRRIFDPVSKTVREARSPE